MKYIFGFFILLGVLSGCGGTETALVQQKTVDNITIELQQLQPSAVNNRQEWLVMLRDSAGEPVEGADVFLELDMPAMEMAENMPQAVGEGAGVYRASGSYTMSGEWEVVVHAIVEGDEHVAAFEMQVP